jgi:RNA polymerase sigma-70 factor (ECF subfamily)
MKSGTSVCRNYCVRSLAKRKEVHDEWALKNLVADEINKEEQLYTELRIEELERAMGMLQVHQRRCIEMFFIQELSYQQISDQTGFSLKQVKSYIQNGKRNLRIRLGGTGHDED